MNENNQLPADPLDRRGFLTRSLAVSAVTAVSIWSASGAPLGGGLAHESGGDSQTTLVISTETGEVFTTELVPGSVVETRDLKLGRLLRKEVILDGFGKQDVPVSEQAGKIESLAHVDPDKHRPPRCLLTWGTGPGFKLNAGLLASATGFSLYSREGVPLRAHLLLDFIVFG